MAERTLLGLAGVLALTLGVGVWGCNGTDGAPSEQPRSMGDARAVRDAAAGGDDARADRRDASGAPAMRDASGLPDASPAAAMDSGVDVQPDASGAAKPPTPGLAADASVPPDAAVGASTATPDASALVPAATLDGVIAACALEDAAFGEDFCDLNAGCGAHSVSLWCKEQAPDRWYCDCKQDSLFSEFIVTSTARDTACGVALSVCGTAGKVVGSGPVTCEAPRVTPRESLCSFSGECTQPAALPLGVEPDVPAQLQSYVFRDGYCSYTDGGRAECACALPAFTAAFELSQGGVPEAVCDAAWTTCAAEPAFQVSGGECEVSFDSNDFAAANPQSCDLELRCFRPLQLGDASATAESPLLVYCSESGSAAECECETPGSFTRTRIDATPAEACYAAAAACAPDLDMSLTPGGMDEPSDAGVPDAGR